MAEPQGKPDDGNSGDGSGNEESEPFTDAQLKALGELVGTVANRAATSHQKRAEVAAKEQADAINARLEKLSGAFEKLQSPPPDDDKPDGGSGRTTVKEVELRFQKQLQTLQEQLEASEGRYKAAEQLRAATELAHKRSVAMGQFRDAVAGKLNPDLMPAVEAVYANRVSIAENGDTLLRVRKAPSKGMPEEDMDLPLKEAVPVFVASDELRPYRPTQGGADGAQRRAPTVVAGGAAASSQASRVVQALEKQGVQGAFD